MMFLRVRLAVGNLSERLGFTGYAWLSVGEGVIAEVVEMEDDRCRVIYVGGTDATIAHSADWFLRSIGATRLEGDA